MTRKQTDDDVTSGDFGAFRRRPVLLALGAGSSIGLASQYGRANVQEGGAGDGGGTDGDGAVTGERCAPCLDRYSGYLRVAGAENDGGEPEEFAPAVTVEMRVDVANVVFRDRPESDSGTEAPTAGTPTGTAGTTETESPPPTGETDAGTPPDGAITGTPSMEGEGGEGVPDFYFDPVGISLRPGDTVEFVTVEDIHTVTAYHPRFFGFQRRVPEGVPGFSSPPVMEGDSWYYRFDEPGVYDMLCLPHDGLGMVVRAVVVEEGSEDAPEAYPELPPDESGVSPVNQRVLNAPELDPGNVLAAGTVAWTDLTGVASGPPGGN